MQRAQEHSSRKLPNGKVLHQRIPVDQIASDGVKLRPIDEASVQEMVKSFSSKGQQQAIRVRPVGEHYLVVFGEHRLEAARRLGMKTIDAIVEPLDEFQALELKVTENAHRNHFVDPWEEGRVFATLLQKKYDGDLGALSDSIGKSTRYIGDRTTVFYNLNPSLREFVGNKLTVANTISLARISPVDKQVQLATIIIKTRTSGSSGFGGGADRLSDGTFAPRTRITPLHECTCGCGNVHKDLRSTITLDPNEDGIGAKATIGLGKGTQSLEYHIENPENPGYSYCGHPLNNRWAVELPAHLDTRTFHVDAKLLCDLCARERRKAQK